MSGIQKKENKLPSMKKKKIHIIKEKNQSTVTESELTKISEFAEEDVETVVTITVFQIFINLRRDR